MVSEYLTICYLPSAQRFERLTADGLKKARQLAEWRRNLTRGWGQVKVLNVESGAAGPVHVGGSLEVKAKVNLDGLSPDDVQVQLFHGLVGSLGEVPRPETVAMSTNGAPREGSTWLFSGTIPCRSSGQHGFAVRVLPRHGDLGNTLRAGAGHLGVGPRLGEAGALLVGHHRLEARVALRALQLEQLDREIRGSWLLIDGLDGLVLLVQEIGQEVKAVVPF
jgi:hypothetical protein